MRIVNPICHARIVLLARNDPCMVSSLLSCPLPRVIVRSLIRLTSLAVEFLMVASHKHIQFMQGHDAFF